MWDDVHFQNSIHNLEIPLPGALIESNSEKFGPKMCSSIGFNAVDDKLE